MRPLLPSTFLLTLFAALPLRADEKNTKPEKAPQSKYVKVGTLGGVARTAGDSGGSLTLRVTLRYLERNAEAQRDYVQRVQQLLIRQQQIMLNPNLLQAQQQMNQLHRDAERLMQSQKNLFRVKSVDKDIEVNLAEDVKVRSARPVRQFDDKGNIKRYTRKELKELRGSDRLPGFSAELSDIQPGLTVLVKVVRLRAVKAPDGLPAVKPMPVESSSKSKDAAPIRLGPQFIGTLVMIVGDPVVK